MLALYEKLQQQLLHSGSSSLVWVSAVVAPMKTPILQQCVWSVHVTAAQIVPNGKKWTSAFTTCGGGYLASNHIGLIGLSRFAGEPSMGGENTDWTTAVNIRFQRSKDKVNNILAWDRQGVSQIPYSTIVLSKRTG